MSCNKKMVCCRVIMGIMMVLAMVASRHANAITCSEAISLLTPCKDFLVGSAAGVTLQCCSGASSLAGKVTSKPDLKIACQCLKQAAAALHVIPERAEMLPGLCHITSPIPIDPNVDCNSIGF